MRKIIIMCAALLLTAGQALAGRQLDLRDVANGEFATERLASVRPMDDGETFSQISSDGQRVVKVSFKTGKEVGVLFDAATARGAKVARVEGYIMSPDGQKMLIQTQTKPIYRHSFTAVYYIFDLHNNKLEPLSDGGPQQTPLFSPDGKMIAFVREGNIFLIKMLYDNAESQVTKDGKPGEVLNGVPDWVNEEEFATSRSMVFTADSKQLCWVRYDESAVREYSFQLYKGAAPSLDEYAAYPGAYAYKYPKAGETNSTVSVHSFDIKSRQTRQMQLPLDNDGYVPRIAMTDDPTRVAVFTLNRHQDQLSIYMANPLSTVCKLSVMERADKYLEERVIGQICISANNILLPSSRSGRMHLYLYTLNGQLVRQVDDGDYDVTDTYGFDEATGNVYFASTVLGPQDRQVCVARKNGKVERLTDKSGCNAATFSKGYKYFVNEWSDLNTPTVTTLRNNTGRLLATLEDNAGLIEKLSAYDLGTKEMFSFTTSEGVELNGWMIKPAGFDAGKAYPVVMYQYGGPSNQQVLDRWNIGMMGQGAVFEQYLAQQGYVVVCVDNRGTGGRGADFEKCTYLRLGELEARDQVETALWLGNQPFVDKSRIGICGWSYGGWNTLMSMSEGRPVFRAGVAIAPVTSWRYYDTVYSERYMRTPKENPQGYDNVSPIARASKLSGSLLICHGLADDNVHFQNTAEYTEALVQADKDFAEVIYTNRNHGIYGGNTRNHLMRQIVKFFDKEMSVIK